MERIKVKSSNISSIGYDEESKTLTIEFHHGGLYEYKDVPKKSYEGLISANSVGVEFHKEIKGSYKYEKIEN